MRVLSSLDLEAIGSEPREHFGYLDRLSEVPIEGTGIQPQPGSGPAIKAGEFFLGYLDESGSKPALPRPEVLSYNGSYVAYLKFEEHVGAFRDFLRQHGQTPEEQELIAAKLMGRWRSGAPLVLAPKKDDPEPGRDMQRTNDFAYAAMDPQGYGCPGGSHIRRMNPRDTAENMQRRKMIRRGATYGPSSPPGAIHVLARQPIDLSRPHPFTQAGDRELNMFLWMPPRGQRAGDILLADSTIFTTLFGGDASLERFWRNIVTK